MSERRQSKFARALVGLLDEAGVFKRSEWATYLGVSASAISQWVNDRTIPRADVLRRIVDVVERSASAPSAPLESFRAMAERPASQVSPHGDRMAPSVARYLEETTYEAAMLELRGRPISEQVEALRSGTRPMPAEISSGDASASIAQDAKPGAYWREPVPRKTRLDASCVGTLRDDLVEALSSSPRVIVFGEAGTGKSSSVANVLAEYFGRTVRRVDLGQVPEGAWCESTSWSESEDPVPMFADGFDQIAVDERSLAAEAISRWSVGRPTIVTSRPVAELDRLEDFVRVEAKSLTRSESWRLLCRRADDVRTEFIGRLWERDELADVLNRPLLIEGALKAGRSDGASTWFRQTEVLDACLAEFAERDSRRRHVRRAEPWAKASRVRYWLHWMALRAVDTGCDALEEAWLDEASVRPTPPIAREVLSYVAELTGLVVQESSRRWHPRDPTWLTFWAAHGFVESTRSASSMFAGRLHEARLRDVFVHSCGLTNDATELLDVAMNAKLSELERAVLLVRGLEQSLVASAESVIGACDAAVGALERLTSEWRIVDGRASSPRRSVWSTVARGAAPRAEDFHAARALLGMLHRSRSSPSQDLIIERLARSGVAYARELSKSFAYEGRLEFEVEPAGGEANLVTRVVEAA